MTIKEGLLKAADLLEQRGWCQGVSVNPATGAMCVMGALDVAFGRFLAGGSSKQIFVNLARNRVLDAVGLPHIEGKILDWNDAEERTREEVVAALRQAAGVA